MGNLNDKYPDVKKTESNVKPTNQNSNKFFSQLSLNSFTRKSNSSLRSVNSEKNTVSSGSSHFRSKKRDQSKNILHSKTSWPVRQVELLFLPEFAYKENLLKSNYIFCEFISHGAFGVVHKVENILNKKDYALKILSKSKIIKEASVKQVKDEVYVQKTIGHHKFVVNCLLYWQDKCSLYIVSDYIPGGELFQLCRRIKHIPEQLVRLFTAEVAIALDFLHNAGIIYRDLKAENVLLDAIGHIKLTDFGLSKWLRYGDRTYTQCGTPRYMAPEIFSGEGYGHSADWWSLGVLCCYMMTNEYPLLQTEETSEKYNSVVLPTMSTETLSPPAIDLLKRLLDINPRFRLRSLLKLFEIAFFKGYSIDDFRNLKIEPLPLIERSLQEPFIIQSEREEQFKNFSSNTM